MAALVLIGLVGGCILFYGLVSLLGLLNPAFDRVMHSVRAATEETGRLLAENFRDKPFWIYLSLLGLLTFVRLTFYIFHVWFPTYGIRVFGEGAMVGSIFGVLNPLMIVFLVPLISIMTMKIRSYTMLMIGTLVSAGSVFLCFIPDSVALSLANGPLGTLIFDYWLEVPVGQRDPFYISLIIFIAVFTVGEAIWSPRLMQFSAEIAPRGKEGSYIALAMLPYFVGKAMAGGMSGYLLATYTPEGLLDYPDHQSAWLWIGGMAILSPIGMLMFQKTFKRLESDAIEEAKRISEEESANVGGAIPAT
jgi:MFS family permease